MPATPTAPTPPASRNAPCPCGSGKRYKDATRHRRAIESAHATTWARCEAGLAPAAFDVAADGHVTVRG